MDPKIPVFASARKHEIMSNVLSLLLQKFRTMQLLSRSLGFKQANNKRENKATDPEKCGKWTQKYLLSV